MHLKIKHTTRYNYDAPVSYALQQIRLMPRNQTGQQVENWNITIDGGNEELSFKDHHNNNVALVSLEEYQTEISIHCHGDIETTDTGGIYGKERNSVPLWYYQRETDLTMPGENIKFLLETLGTEHQSDDIPRLHLLSKLIAEAVQYTPGTTGAETTAEQSLEGKAGVCQDHAHIFITAARELGYPARYVSGYLMMDDRVDQDASHAWAEAYVPHLGWVGIDVSNIISPDERYVRIATGLDFNEASPIRGMRIGNSDERMVVSLQVQQ